MSFSIIIDEMSVIFFEAFFSVDTEEVVEVMDMVLVVEDGVVEYI